MNRGSLSIRTIVALVVVFLFAMFLLQNTAMVEIRLLFWKVSLSRSLLLIGSAVAGLLTGVLISREILGKRGRP
ncbi:MAG: lipopolysaccharide assembly protein LapA domain-containing protein [Thermodesulfobacteriota bacterium]